MFPVTLTTPSSTSRRSEQGTTSTATTSISKHQPASSSRAKNKRRATKITQRNNFSHCKYLRGAVWLSERENIWIFEYLNIRMHPYPHQLLPAESVHVSILCAGVFVNIRHRYDLVHLYFFVNIRAGHFFCRMYIIWKCRQQLNNDKCYRRHATYSCCMLHDIYI